MGYDKAKFSFMYVFSKLGLGLSADWSTWVSLQRMLFSYFNSKDYESC
jgi:hypothetical protein